MKPVIVNSKKQPKLYLDACKSTLFCGIIDSMRTDKTSNLRSSLANANKKIIAQDKIKIESLGRAKKTATIVFEILCRQPKITVSDLVKKTGISKQTITKTVKKLVVLGIMQPIKDQSRYQVYCYSRLIGSAKDMVVNDIGTQSKTGIYLGFDGREVAILQASTPTKVKFKPDLNHNSQPNNANSPNTLYICDNIDGLKYIKNNKFKPFHLIFGDAIYNQKKARKTRQYKDTYDEHSDYLAFMYPRLMLCKNLLDEKGLMVIAIGETESANTKLICNEIFGEENFINTIVVESGVNAGIYSSHSDKFLAETKFYLLVYAKDKKKIRFLNRLYDLIEEKFAKEYNTIITEDLNHKPLIEYLKQEKWIEKEFEDHGLKMTLNNIGKLMEVSQRFETYIYEKIAPMLYKSTAPFKKYTSEAQNQPQNRVFRLDDKLLLKTENGSTIEYKAFSCRLQENEGQKQNAIARGTVWKGYQKYKSAIKKQGGVEFAGKKTLRLMMDLLHLINNKNARIADIFAGSGTTGYAVFAQNKKDNGKRSFVLLQIAEKIQDGSANQGKFRTVDELTVYGLNNAIEETSTTDGFKIYRATKS